MTWETRDLPVLRAIVELTESGTSVIQPHDLSRHLAMPYRDVELARPPWVGPTAAISTSSPPH